MKEDDIIVLILKDILTRWKQSAGMETPAASRSEVSPSRTPLSSTPPGEDSGKTRVLHGDIAPQNTEEARNKVSPSKEADEASSAAQEDEGPGDLMETIILRSDDKQG